MSRGKISSSSVLPQPPSGRGTNGARYAALGLPATGWRTRPTAPIGRAASIGSGIRERLSCAAPTPPAADAEHLARGDVPNPCKHCIGMQARVTVVDIAKLSRGPSASWWGWCCAGPSGKGKRRARATPSSSSSWTKLNHVRAARGPQSGHLPAGPRGVVARPGPGQRSPVFLHPDPLDPLFPVPAPGRSAGSSVGGDCPRVRTSYPAGSSRTIGVFPPPRASRAT